MSIASRIEQIEQHIENAYESIGNKGVDLRDKLNIDLKGNTSQEVVSGEVGLEVEDTSIYVDDVNEDKENYITLKGNTYQDSTSGKNLLPNNITSQTINGITITKNNDGSLLINGTSNATTILIFGEKTLQAGTYTLSTHKEGAVDNSCYISSVDTSTGSEIAGSSFRMDNSNSKTYTLSETTTISYRFYTGGSRTFTNFKIYPMLEQGSSATDYEPYTNGASPNPDYPQEIEVVTGENEVKVEGKNLFDKDSASLVQKGVNSTTGMIFDTNTKRLENDNLILLQVGTYTISNAICDNVWVWAYDLNQNYLYQKIMLNWYTGNSYTFTINEDLYIRFIWKKSDNSEININDNFNIQLEVGTTATTYEAYKGQTYEVNLGSIELCKIGTYQDRIYKNNGNWYLHKEIGKVVLNGNSKSVYYNNVYNNIYQFNHLVDSALTNYNQNTIYVFANFLKGVIWGNNWTIDNSITLQSNGNLKLNTSKFDNANDFNLWLTTHNITCYYVLATPTETQITDTTLVNQLEALYQAQIHSITHINTETSNLLPYIDLKYNVVTASPSPDRASEVEVVKGNNVIKVQSKNLLSFTDLSGIAITNGKVDLSSKTSGFTGNFNFTQATLKAGNYCFYFNPKTKPSNSTQNLVDENNNVIGTFNYKNTGYSYCDFTLSEEKTISQFKLWLGTNVYNNILEEISLINGTHEDIGNYVNYQSQSYNITLGNLELCKIGDYQDYFYKENGNWYKYAMIGKVVLDGTNVVFTYQDQNVYPNALMIPYSSRPRGLGDTSSVICSHFSNIATNVGTTLNTLYWSASSQMWICKEGFTSLNNGNTWLQSQYNNGTPVIVYYALETPTTTEITDTKLINQLNALADARKYEDGIETIINQTNSGLSFEIEINPTHLNRNIENISTEIDKIETTEWKPQPDWWDIKTIIKDDEENYPYKIIALQDEGAKTLNIEIDSLFGAKKVKLSDGQEITTSGLYTVNEEGLKSCSKGYKTFYSIWYFNDIPNFSYYSIGHFFHNSRHIYFYNIGNINLNSTFSWVSNQNRLLEAVESNKQITTALSNEAFRILQANCLRKIPDWIFRRNGNIHSPNTIGFSIAPYIKYKDMTKIINSRNFDFTSGTAPEITNSFLDETIDFENDWGMPTTLFTTTSSIIGPYAVQKMDFENVTSFKGTLNVSEVYEVYNIKISSNYFTGEMLSHDTLVRVLNALYNYSGSEDTYTLTLGATNLAKLTNDEKAIATNKGWTLA